MGEDKSFLPFADKTSLIEYQYNKLSKIFSKVYISSKINKFEFKTNLILDEGEIFSPMIALNSILKKMKNEKLAEKVFIITVDTPLVNHKIIKEIIDNSKNTEITIAKTKEKTHNLCGVFSTNLLDKITALLKQDIHKINSLIKNSNTLHLTFENEEKFLNLNTKEEYKKALDIIRNSYDTHNQQIN